MSMDPFGSVYLQFWRRCTFALIPPIAQKLDNVTLLNENSLKSEKWKKFYLSNLAAFVKFCSYQFSPDFVKARANQSRILTLKEDIESGCVFEVPEDTLYLTHIFKLLIIGMLHFDQEVRLGTLSAINILMKHSEVSNNDKNNICLSFIKSSAYIYVSRSIDLCCSPFSFEGEVVEALRSLTCSLSCLPSVRDSTFQCIVLSTLSSTVREVVERALSDAAEIQKRRKIIDLALGLGTNEIAKSFRMYSQFSLYQKSKTEMLDVYHYPAGLLSLSCAIVIKHLLEIDPHFVVKYGALSVLISYILSSSRQHLAHQLLMSIICISNSSSAKREIFSNIFRPLLEIFTYTSSDFEWARSGKAEYAQKLNQSADLLETLFASWTGFISAVSYSSQPTRFYKSGLHFLVKVLQYGDILCRLKILQLVSSLLAIETPNINMSSYQNLENPDAQSDIGLESLNLNYVFNSATCSRFIDLRSNFRTFVFNALAEVGLIKVLKDIQNKFGNSSHGDEEQNHSSAINIQLVAAASRLLSELCLIFMPIFPEHFSKYFNILLPTAVTHNEKMRTKSYVKDLGSFFSDVAKHNCLSGLNLDRLNLRNNVRASSTRHSQLASSVTFGKYDGTRLSTFVVDHLRCLYNPSRSRIPKSNVNFGVHLNQLLFESRVVCQSISYNVKQTRFERKYNLAMLEFVTSRCPSVFNRLAVS